MSKVIQPISPAMYSPDRNHSPRPRILSVTETLFLLMLVAVLLAYAPVLHMASRERALDARCVSNLRALSTALFAFAQDNDGRYPITEGKYDSRQTNWVLLLSEGGFAEPLQRYDTSGGLTEWFCPAALSRRTVSAGSANTYGLNWQASGGGWFSEGTAPGPGVAERPDLMGQVMDGHWSGTTYRTHVSSPAGIQVPDFVHAAEAGGGARINVAYVDGRIGPLRQEDLPLDPTDTFWTGLED